MIKVRMTYNVVTSESAEGCYYSDHGFYEPGGYYYSIADDSFQELVKDGGWDAALNEQTPDPMEFESAEELEEWIRDELGAVEASSYPLRFLSARDWLEQADGSENPTTGAVTRLCVHFVSGDPDAWVAVMRAVAD